MCMVCIAFNFNTFFQLYSFYHNCILDSSSPLPFYLFSQKSLLGREHFLSFHCDSSWLWSFDIFIKLAHYRLLPFRTTCIIKKWFWMVWNTFCNLSTEFAVVQKVLNVHFHLYICGNWKWLNPSQRTKVKSTKLLQWGWSQYWEHIFLIFSKFYFFYCTASFFVVIFFNYISCTKKVCLY